MTDTQLRDVVLGALTDVAPDADLAGLDPDADLVEELDIDSMDFLNVIVRINEVTGVEIPERDYGKLTTLNELVSYLAPAPT
jgi:acyl carrier protein